MSRISFQIAYLGFQLAFNRQTPKIQTSFLFSSQFANEFVQPDFTLRLKALNVESDNLHEQEHAVLHFDLICDVVTVGFGSVFNKRSQHILAKKNITFAYLKY